MRLIYPISRNEAPILKTHEMQAQQLRYERKTELARLRDLERVLDKKINLKVERKPTQAA
jgi:hypothetical protein